MVLKTTVEILGAIVLIGILLLVIGLLALGIVQLARGIRDVWKEEY